MSNLNIASKANQAVTLPALLVASYVKELDSDTEITIKFEEVDALDSGDKAHIELIVRRDAPTYGSEQVISKLLVAYPFLQEKNESLVS